MHRFVVLKIKFLLKSPLAYRPPPAPFQKEGPVTIGSLVCLSAAHFLPYGGIWQTAPPPLQCANHLCNQRPPPHTDTSQFVSGCLTRSNSFLLPWRAEKERRQTFAESLSLPGEFQGIGKCTVQLDQVGSQMVWHVGTTQHAK